MAIRLRHPIGYPERMLTGVWLTSGILSAAMFSFAVRRRVSKAKAAAKWTRLHTLLSNRQIPRQDIARTIVSLGKPLDKEKIQKAKDAVLQYRDHEDAWVRREVLWFVGSWGRLRECLPVLIKALREDPFEDNRGFAASSIGATMRGTQDPLAIKELVAVLRNESEETAVRLHTYAALLLTVKGESASRETYAFLDEEKSLNDVDWQWINLLASRP